MEIQEAMPLFLDDYEYYFMTMTQFLQGDEIVNLLKSVEVGDYEMAMNCAYDIKSMSGSLKITKAFQLAQALCDHLHTKEYKAVQTDIQQIRSIIEPLKQMISESRKSL